MSRIKDLLLILLGIPVIAIILLLAGLVGIERFVRWLNYLDPMEQEMRWWKKNYHNRD
jgi:hypothetical protein